MIGLLGLVSFTVVRRTKEIGIRKINGCTNMNIFLLISREYYIMLLFAFIVASPSALMVFEKIPSANKLHAQPWVYVLGFGIVFMIILLTTSYQTLIAALRNPVEALRYE
jgi:putative ABC transport system permease protein